MTARVTQEATDRLATMVGWIRTIEPEACLADLLEAKALMDELVTRQEAHCEEVRERQRLLALPDGDLW